MGDRPADATTQVMEESARLLYPDVELHVIEGADRGLKCKLEPPAIRVGTGAASHLRLQDRAVSRPHCRFNLTADGWTVADLNSANGTILNGTPLTAAPLSLKDGDVLMIGETTLLFRLPA